MRQLLLSFLVLATSVGKATEALLELKVGGSKKEVSLDGVPWYTGGVSTSRAFLTGEVTEVSSDVQTSPQQTWLSETCTVRVETAFGHLKQLGGITTAVLENGMEHSPYVPVDPTWGRLRHLQKGQKILVLLHEYEGRPSFGSEAVIELKEATHTLPEILRRTAFNPAGFGTEDLAVVKAASLLLHDQLRAEGADRKEPATASRIGTGLTAIAGVAVLAALYLTRRAKKHRLTR